MITNTALASVLDDDRRQHSAQRYRLHIEADMSLHTLRRTFGRWLENIGRRLQRPVHAASH